MSYNIHVSSYFAKEAKRLGKKYPSFKHDLDKFKKSLQENPLQGTELSPGIRKIRMAIESKHKGLSVELELSLIIFLHKNKMER